MWCWRTRLRAGGSLTRLNADPLPAGVSEDGTVACIDCGSVHAGATDLLSQLRDDVHGLERDLRVKRAAIKRLQAEQDEALRASPFYADAQAVLERWRELCAPNAKELGGKRLELAIARLRGKYTRAELELSILGYSRFPYVTDKGRAPDGKPNQWQADAEQILRSPKMVEQGWRLAKRQVSAAPTNLAEIPWRKVRRENRRAIVAYLTKRFGGGIEDGYDFMAWPCPRCDNAPASTLRVAAEGSSLAYLVTSSCCGLSDEQMLALMLQPVPEPNPFEQQSLEVAA